MTSFISKVKQIAEPWIKGVQCPIGVRIQGDDLAEFLLVQQLAVLFDQRLDAIADPRALFHVAFGTDDHAVFDCDHVDSPGYRATGGSA
jgi:hypothetical protein